MKTREEPIEDDQVRDILFKLAAGFPLAKIAKLYNRPYQTILRIRNNETYRHVSREGVEEAARFATWARVEAKVLPDIGPAVQARQLPPIGEAVKARQLPPIGPAVPAHNPVKREQEIVDVNAAASLLRLTQAMAKEPAEQVDPLELFMQAGRENVEEVLARAAKLKPAGQLSDEAKAAQERAERGE